jgi:hypothetical protein
MGSTDETGKPFDLDLQLATCLQEFEGDRQEYWRERSEGGDWGLEDRLFGHAEGVASLLMKDAEALVTAATRTAPETFSDERLAFLKEVEAHRKELLALIEKGFGTKPIPNGVRQWASSQALSGRPEDGSLMKLVWERLCISLASDLVEGRLVRGANRMLQLIEVVVEAEPSDVTLRFLRRVSRCYVLGLDAECAILCRGALDTAFRSAVSDRDLDRLGVRPGAGYGYTLAQRMKGAADTGLLGPQAREAARRINKAATEVSHEDPDLVPDLLPLIQDTLLVVQKFSPRRP